MKVNFIHLRCHTSYSLGESSLTIKSLIPLLKKYNMPALAITDSNNLFGAREFSYVLSENGIKPIIGMELNISYNLNNFVNSNESIKSDTKSVTNNTYKNTYLSTKENNNINASMVLLAKNEAGYLNLLKLHKELYVNRSFNKDISVDFNVLLKHSNDLILLSGGNEGFLGKVLLENNEKITHSILNLLKEAFLDNFYIELNRYNNIHNIDLENKFLEIAQKYELPIVATANPFFSSKDDFEANDILMCIGQGKFVNDYDRHILSSDQYFKNQDEMVNLFKDLPEALENTVNIAQKCNFLVKSKLPSLPLYQEGRDEVHLLKEQSYNGLKYKLNKYVKLLQKTQPLTEHDIQKLEEEYKSRLEFEISIIAKMNFAGYFLIVADFINWAKSQNIPVGPGRGSGAGSLVAWALNITDINPMQFGLFFERFLNPERVSMPDFDIDFCQRRRDEVINYVVNKYGKDRVAQIITFGSLQTRAAIRDVGRVLGLPYSSVDKICKRIPYSTPSNPTNIAKVLKEEKELQKDIESFYMLKYLFDIALKLENLYRNVSTHAAGIVISSKPLIEVVPLYYDNDSDTNLPVSGFSMKYVEEVGLVKFDFLGLKTLTVIHGTVNRIKNTQGIKINIEDIPLAEEKISKLLTSGKTLGIFQLESLGMRDVLMQLKPDKIEDIIAIISLYRPGPMENIPTYIKRKHGNEEVEYLHPLMENILKETFGIMIYQEQVMQIAQNLAGYSLGEADLLRRAMGKKKPEEMAQQKSKFVKGALHNNIHDTLASTIFDQMEKFAGYGFNKSHAAAYAFISWQTAYLKSYFPAEFIAESMTYDMQDTDKIAILIEDAKEFNIKVLSPDVNYADSTFITFKDENGNLFIRYSLLAIKGTSKSLVNQIQQEVRKNGFFTSIEDFFLRIPSNYLNKKQLEALIKSGSLDSLEPNRGKLLSNIDILLNFNTNAFTDDNVDQGLLFDDFKTENNKMLSLKEVGNLDLQEKLSMEAEVIGFFISGHPLTDYESNFKNLNIVKYSELIENEIKNANLAVVVLKVKSSKTRNNAKYITLSCSDVSSNFNIILYGKSYDSFSTKVQEGGIYNIKIAARYDGTEARLFVEDLQEFDVSNNNLNNTKDKTSVEENNKNMGLQICINPTKDKLYKLQNIVKNINEGTTPILLKLLLENGEYKLIDLGYKLFITEDVKTSLKSFADIEEIILQVNN